MVPLAVGQNNLTEQLRKKTKALKLLNQFFEKLEEFEKSTTPSERNLESIFKSKQCKSYLLKQVEPENYVKFQTVWEGVKNLLNTIEKEKDFKAIKADRLLLKEDLKKIKGFVQRSGLL